MRLAMGRAGKLAVSAAFPYKAGAVHTDNVEVLPRRLAKPPEGGLVAEELCPCLRRGRQTAGGRSRSSRCRSIRTRPPSRRSRPTCATFHRSFLLRKCKT